MSIFRRMSEHRKRQATDGGPGAGTDDGLRGALSQVLEIQAEHHFPLGDEEPSEFVEACRIYARHLGSGAPLPPGVIGGKALATAIPKLLADRRRAEVRYVDERVGGLRNALQEIVAGLHNLTTGGQQTNETISASIERLGRAADSNSLEELREVVRGAVTEISTSVAEQNKRLQAELDQLGQKLAGVREDLLKARQQAETDPLTQLNNRGSFDAALQSYVQLSTLGGQSLTLLMVDLDHFKWVNDKHGHPAGDEVLRKTADCLAATFPRRTDFAARYGGEEFAVLLLDVDVQQVEPLAKRLLDRVRALRVPICEPPLTITCSIGCAVHARGEDGAALIARADRALYRAKHDGRDRSVID